MSVAALPRNETSATRSVLMSGSGEQVVVGGPALALAGASMVVSAGALVVASVPALGGITILGVLLVVGLLLLALLITTGCGPPN